jgi:hypothetical protein
MPCATGTSRAVLCFFGESLSVSDAGGVAGESGVELWWTTFIANLGTESAGERGIQKMISTFGQFGASKNKQSQTFGDHRGSAV